MNISLYAKLSKIAYLGKNAIIEYKRLGYNTHYFISYTNAQCHIIKKEKTIVICFRGTDDVKDWVNNAKFSLVKCPFSDGFVHEGFLLEFNKLYPSIIRILQKYDFDYLELCGHSLGGALATIGASIFKNVNILYTYGSPRVGCKTFTNTISTSHIRVVNNNDIVPRLPPTLFSYSHHGDLVYINCKGNIVKYTTFQKLKDRLLGRYYAWKKCVVFDGLYDHSIEKYIQYL